MQPQSDSLSQYGENGEAAMPVALQIRAAAAVAPASNDNGRGVFGASSRRSVVAPDGFWAAVRQAAGEGMRLDYLAPGVLRIAGAAR